MSEINETAITWDHDIGRVVVSTRSRKIAQRLRKIGARELFVGDGYWTFESTDELVRISLNRKRKGRVENLPRAGLKSA